MEKLKGVENEIKKDVSTRLNEYKRSVTVAYTFKWNSMQRWQCPVLDDTHLKPLSD